MFRKKYILEFLLIIYSILSIESLPLLSKFKIKTINTFIEGSDLQSNEHSINREDGVSLYKKKQRLEFWTSFSICLSYFSINFGIFSIPPSLLSIESDPNLIITSLNNEISDNNGFAPYMRAGTLSTMFGKFLLGVPTDIIGGEMMLSLAMITIMLSTYFASCSTSLRSIGIAWILMSVAYSSAFGATGEIIRRSFQSKEKRTIQVGKVAGFSRLGSLSSSLFYGYLLNILNSKHLKHAKHLKDSAYSNNEGPINLGLGIRAEKGCDWRVLLRAASIFEGTAWIIYSFGLMLKRRNFQTNHSYNNSHTDIHNINDGSSDNGGAAGASSLYISLARNPTFYLMLLFKALLTLTSNFITYTPLYMSSSTGLRLSSDKAAVAAAAFSVGSTLSSIYCTPYYANLGNDNNYNDSYNNNYNNNYNNRYNNDYNNRYNNDYSSIGGSSIGGSSIGSSKQVKFAFLCTLGTAFISMLLAIHSYAFTLTLIPATSTTTIAVPQIYSMIRSTPKSLIIALISLWGFLFSTPFYLPPNMIAIELGQNIVNDIQYRDNNNNNNNINNNNSIDNNNINKQRKDNFIYNNKSRVATITNLFDGAGFLVAALFSGYALRNGRDGNWTPVFGVLSCSSFISALLLLLINMINRLEQNKKDN